MRAATSALDRLYALDTPEALQECLNTYLTEFKETVTLAKRHSDEDFIKDALSGNAALSKMLYGCYADGLRHSVDYVQVGQDLSAQWHANTDRFAAYKAYHITQELRHAEQRYADDPELKRAVQESIVHKYRRYQAAEEQTARHRARAGKQWERFHDPDRVRLFPNIQWLPSRSANPREEHQAFYNRIWPKDDIFWDYNQPGALWNCKCDWQEVKTHATDTTPKGETPKTVSPKGLQGNTAKTGRLFSENHPYFAKASIRLETINYVGCTKMRSSEHKDYTIQTETGDVNVTSWFYDETAKSNINRNEYYLKNELANNLRSYLPRFKYNGTEPIDLSHNNPNGKPYKRKKKATCFHVYTANMFGHDFVAKAIEMKDGTVKMWTLYIK